MYYHGPIKMNMNLTLECNKHCNWNVTVPDSGIHPTLAFLRSVSNLRTFSSLLSRKSRSAMLSLCWAYSRLQRVIPLDIPEMSDIRFSSETRKKTKWKINFAIQLEGRHGSVGKVWDLWLKSPCCDNFPIGRACCYHCLDPWRGPKTNGPWIANSQASLAWWPAK